MLKSETDLSTPDVIAKGRLLSVEELSLLELYQRQDAMSTQLWNHFLLANVAVVGTVALIAAKFPDGSMAWVMGGFVFVVWMSFTVAGLSAILNVQRLLAAIAHQVEGNVGDKTPLFSGVTRRSSQILFFHILVDFGIFALCTLLIWERSPGS